MPSSSAAESFLYIWYDTKNKMFYLGKHKGTPDDSYTHSSTIMESFNKDNIPSYMKRRILAYGTDEEMCLLEHECLKNRKEKKWDRYYNRGLGDPRYVDQSGENHYNYKDGLSRTKEGQRNYYRKKRDQIRTRVRKWSKTWREKNREEINEYKNNWIRENKEKYLESRKQYYAENKSKIRETKRVWREKNREKINEQQRIRRARKKAERLASGATLPI